MITGPTKTSCRRRLIFSMNIPITRSAVIECNLWTKEEQRSPGFFSTLPAGTYTIADLFDENWVLEPAQSCIDGVPLVPCLTGFLPCKWRIGRCTF